MDYRVPDAVRFPRGARMVKTVLIFLLVGALLGVIAASYIVPPALSWYSEPAGLPNGAQIQALVQIPEVIRYATLVTTKRCPCDEVCELKHARGARVGKERNVRHVPQSAERAAFNSVRAEESLQARLVPRFVEDH